MRNCGLEGTLCERLLTIFVILKASATSFLHNRGFEAAATIAFYGVFAMIPLFMAVTFLLSYVFVSYRPVSRAVEHLIIQIVPQYYEIILSEVFSLTEKKTWGLIGVLALLWSVVPLVASIRSAFIRVFKAQRSTNFIKEKLLDVATVLLVMMLFIGLVGSEILYFSILDDYPVQKGADFDFLHLVGPLTAATLFLSAFFAVFSPVRLEWWNVLAGSFLTASLWSIVRPLFVLFLDYNPDYGFAFGSLKAVFILVVWVYYTFAVILFGTEVVANTRRRDALLLSRLFSRSPSERSLKTYIPERFIRSFECDEVIFEEGAIGREMYYILSGSVRIVKKDRLLREMKPGEYFGEVAMLIQVPRTASAVAAAPDTRLAVVSEKNLDVFLRENPWIVLSFLKEMSSRLKRTNDDMGELSTTCRVWEDGMGSK